MQLNKKDTYIDPEALALIKRAFNFIDKHRGPQERTNEKVLGGGAEKSHKGDVKDPKHDGRLSENKNKEKNDSDDQLQEDRNKRKEEENAKKKKIMKLKELQMKVNPALKKTVAANKTTTAAAPGGYGAPKQKLTRPIQPPTRTPTPGTAPTAAPAPAPAARATPPAVPTNAPPSRAPSAGAPAGVGLPPSQRPGPSAEQLAEKSRETLGRPAPTFSGMGRQQPPQPAAVRAPGGGYAPAPGTPGYKPPVVESKPVYQKQIDQVRQDPHANFLLGENPVKPSDPRFDNVRQRLQQRQNQASSVQERNEIQIKLSKMAVELIKAGRLNIRNG